MEYLSDTKWEWSFPVSSIQNGYNVELIVVVRSFTDIDD